MVFFFFLGFIYLSVCIFFFTFVMELAVIVAVIIDGIVNDCLIEYYCCLFCLASLLPPCFPNLTSVWFRGTAHLQQDKC